jgi:GAF domain-containing protein
MKSRRARRLLFRRPLPAGSSSSVHFGRELPVISSRREVHHRFIALLHGDKGLRACHESSPPKIYGTTTIADTMQRIFQIFINCIGC